LDYLQKNVYFGCARNVVAAGCNPIKSISPAPNFFVFWSNANYKNSKEQNYFTMNTILIKIANFAGDKKAYGPQN